MTDPWVDWDALWKILVFGLIAGAGLPAIFAIGLRALSAGPQAADVDGGTHDHVWGGSVAGLVGASLCFAVVLAAVGWGVYSIVNGS